MLGNFQGGEKASRGGGLPCSPPPPNKYVATCTYTLCTYVNLVDFCVYLYTLLISLQW